MSTGGVGGSEVIGNNGPVVGERMSPLPVGSMVPGSVPLTLLGEVIPTAIPCTAVDK